MGVAATAAAVAGLAAGARHDLAMSDSAATGLIVGLGVGGSFVLVLALTIRAARQSNRAGAAAAGRARAAQGRSGRLRTRPHGGADVQTGGHDRYPQQPYSAAEPASHRPYSRPYRVPAQDEQLGRAQTNGHRPTGPVGAPTTPWSPTED